MTTATEPCPPVPIGNPEGPATAGPEHDLPVTVIERRSGWQAFDLAELWRFRELLYFLVWRDIKVRYKQTALGAAWAILQPLATMAVFALFLGRASGITGELAYPYALFVLAGLLPWTFFGNALLMAGPSVVQNQNLVTKVYFPRLLIPLSAVGAGLVDFFISFFLLLGMMALFGVWPGWHFLWLPLVLSLLVIAALSVGTLLAALTVTYRDFRFVLPFLVQLWMFATPSIYMQADQAVGEGWLWALPLNPAYGLILNFRQAALGGPMDYYALAVSGGASIILLLLGSFYFRKIERGFADII
jgi:homopolymeric O-antigen transport system permease protein